MEVARFWRTRHQRYQLVGEVCPHCGTKIFPPRDVCPACEGEAKTPFTFSGRGEVYSFTTIHSAPAGFEKYVPYVVALVRLEEGPLVTAQLTDVEEKDVYIGMPVEMVTRVLREDGERGVIVYGYKFRPRLLQPEPQPQRELEATATA
ncbi:MAG: Zn-ribbon domain-containing OB-fold protein [Anaerolineae bacterium]|nr:Zn-ribbon domain-containing OB-fold protein [Anaerolineae bacterium]